MNFLVIFMHTIVDRISRSLGLKIACVLSASFVLAVSAQISIPMYPVPFTLQSVTVLFLAFALGHRLAVAAVGAYLIEGALGLPVYAHFTCGLPVLFGPTGGYLFGFLASAYVAGCMYEHVKSRRVFHLFLIGIMGEVPLFACGYVYLAFFVGWTQAFWLGVFPFLASTCLKNILLALLINRKFSNI